MIFLPRSHTILHATSVLGGFRLLPKIIQLRNSMQAITEQAWRAIPEQAQQEVYDFFLCIKQRYASPFSQDHSETIAFSNHSANLIEDWNSEEEDELWT